MSLSPLCCWDASWQPLAGSSSDAVSQLRAVFRGQHHSYQLSHVPVWGHRVGTAGILSHLRPCCPPTQPTLQPGSSGLCLSLPPAKCQASVSKDSQTGGTLKILPVWVTLFPIPLKLRRISKFCGGESFSQIHGILLSVSHDYSWRIPSPFGDVCEALI